MANIDIQMQDYEGNIIHPQTNAKVVEYKGTNVSRTLDSLSDRDEVFIQDTEPKNDGLWIDTSEDSTEAVEGDNGVVKAIRDYIDTDVKATVEKNKQLVQENNKIVKDIQTNVGDRLDVVPQLSGQNLLINGDFQVWQRGVSFNVIKDGKYNYTADRWIVQTDSDNIIARSLNDGGMRVDMSKFNGTYTNVIQLLELPFYKKLIDKTVTIKIKFKNEVSNIAIGLRALPDASATHILMNKTSKEFVITAKIPRCSVECIKFMIYVQSKTQQILDFEYIKMELGNSSTPFIPRLYDEELALCKRYYFRNKWKVLRCLEVIPNFISSCEYNFPVQMRIFPTIKPLVEQPIYQIHTIDFLTNIVNPTTQQITPYQIGVYNDSMCCFRYNHNIGLSKDYILHIKDYAYEFDAEIY